MIYKLIMKDGAWITRKYNNKEGINYDVIYKLWGQSYEGFVLIEKYRVQSEMHIKTQDDYITYVVQKERYPEYYL